MPIWLRRYTYSTISEYYEEQQQEQKKSSNTKEAPLRPNVSPSYKTKASSK